MDSIKYQKILDANVQQSVKGLAPTTGQGSKADLKESQAEAFLTATLTVPLIWTSLKICGQISNMLCVQEPKNNSELVDSVIPTVICSKSGWKILNQQ